MEPQTSPVAGTCPVCAGVLDGAAWRCARCGAGAHADCHAWFGRCAIYGCEPAALTLGPEGLPVETEATPRTELSVREPGSWLPGLPMMAAWPLLGAVAAVALYGLPRGDYAVVLACVVLFRVRWRVRAEQRRFDQEILLAGIPIVRYAVPFEDVLRLEVTSSEALPRLVLVTRAGDAIPLSGEYLQTPTRAARDLRVAQQLRETTTLHVTDDIGCDPSRSGKLMERVRERALAARPAATRRALMAAATLFAVTALMWLAGPREPAYARGVVAALFGADLLLAYAAWASARPASAYTRHGQLLGAGLVQADRQLRGPWLTGPVAWLPLLGDGALVVLAAWFAARGLKGFDALLACYLGALASMVTGVRRASLVRAMSQVELYRLAERDPALEQLVEDARTQRREILRAEPARHLSRKQGVCIFLAAVLASLSPDLHGLVPDWLAVVILFSPVWVAGLGLLYGVRYGRALAELKRRAALPEAKP